MDPNGGINPANPRLDSMTPPAQPQPPVQQPMPAVAPVVTPPSIDAVPTVTPSAPVVPTGFNDVVDDSLGIEQELPKKSSGKLKKVLLTLLGIIVVLGAAAGAYYYGFTTGKTKGQKEAAADYQSKLANLQKDQTNANSSDTQASDAELDLSSLQDPKYIDETIEGEIGKQVSASDGLVLKVTNIERNYKSTDSNYKLDSSKELVKVNFIIGNAAKDKPKDISSFNLKLENSSGAQLIPENIASYPDKFETADYRSSHKKNKPRSVYSDTFFSSGKYGSYY